MLIVKKVYSVSVDKRESCVVLDIDDKARLVVRFDDGTEKALSTGEVSIKMN